MRTMALCAAWLAQWLFAGIAFANTAPALSTADTQAVVGWIARQVSNARQPYCYRQSYDRGVGAPLSTCGPNDEKNGLLCYPKCNANYGGAGPACWENCPSGFTDTGALCTRPASTDHLSIHAADCPSGFHNTGTACYRVWPPKSESLSHSHCPAGMERKGAFCYSVCPSGYTNTGVSCYRGPDTVAKKTYTRGAGAPMQCTASQQEDAGLCYTPCKDGFHGIASICWQTCPAGKTACGAGCASSASACASSTANMVIAPVMLAANILSDGTTSEFTQKYQAVIDDAKAYKNAAGAAFKFGQTINLWVGDYLANFSKLTTPEVERQLEARFKGDSLNWIKSQYALQNLHLMMVKDLGDTAATALSAYSAYDPTGVTGVISAFMNPRCSVPDPFPNVRLLY